MSNMNPMEGGPVAAAVETGRVSGFRRAMIAAGIGVTSIITGGALMARGEEVPCDPNIFACEGGVPPTDAEPVPGDPEPGVPVSTDPEWDDKGGELTTTTTTLPEETTTTTLPEETTTTTAAATTTTVAPGTTTTTTEAIASTTTTEAPTTTAAATTTTQAVPGTPPPVAETN